MIHLEGLTKYFGSSAAVKELNLHVRRGEIFAFLGPNGAGKTTTIRMMMGLLNPTFGSVSLAGFNLANEPLEAKKRCGFIPDRPFLYEKLTAVEMLRFSADLYLMESSRIEGRISQLLELFDLTPWGTELIESFSHGMKQRLAFAAALLHEPEILIVDEPMVGMDPRGARMLRSLLRDLANQGCTIFLSTHSLEVAEALADRIGIIQKGELLALGTLSELQAHAGHEGNLEEIFLKLTGAVDLLNVIGALRA